MHFSKTYSQILEQLPPELRENAIQYRQLKKLINQVVSELSSLGLSPTVLHELIAESPPNEAAEGDANEAGSSSSGGGESGEPGTLADGDDSAEATTSKVSDRPRIVYELVEHSDRIEPHLKLWVEVPDGSDLSKQWNGIFSLEQEEVAEDEEGREGDSKREMKPATNVLWTLHQKLHQESKEVGSIDSRTSLDADGIPQISTEGATRLSTGSRKQELIIPLVSDTEFFNNLVSALEGMSTHMVNVHNEFTQTLKQLSRTISESALPASASRSFNPHSAVTSHPGSIAVSTMLPSKSDLYAWREVFQLYVEAEIFEHVGEVHHGERSAEESEKRLHLFTQQATQRGLADPRKFKGKGSRQAWESFIALNLFILNIKKLSEANTEATRKILKKHTKRTALPLTLLTPFSNTTTAREDGFAIPSHLALFSRLTTTTLPRTFVQAIGETLLPIIPHVDDYSCLICTSIAFKPIRLNCGHLFCVRCLVKMQKRGQAECPLCRASVVLTANRNNVDWALLNFMQDWFPIEAKAKLKSNEQEATKEQMEELGFDPDRPCRIM